MKAIRILGRNIRDSFKSVFRNFSLSLASIISIIITLLVVSLSIVLSLNVNNFTKEVEKDLTIVLFLDSDISAARIELESVDVCKDNYKDSEFTELEISKRCSSIIDEIEKIENVESIQVYDKMRIRTDLMDESEVYNSLMEKYSDRTLNPLLDSIQVKASSIEHIDAVAEKLSKIEDVSSVEYGEGLVEDLVSVFDVIRTGSIWVVVALVLVTAFLITNTIKITIYSRKREIEIMRLVGASNINIKIPFILEGLFLGIFGSIIPILVTVFGYEEFFIIFSTQNFSPIFKLIEPYPFVYLVSLFLLIIGALVGMLGSSLAVRKHLKI